MTSETNQALQYQAMPMVETMVEESTETTGTYDLSFGAMVDTALPAGQYVNNVLVSAVANPSYVTGLMSLTYMQDMTTNICRETKGTDQSPAQDASGSYIVTPGNEVSKQLIDIRDGKEYWVSKLADGNCWMTQNLALDLNEKTLPLKPESSDVAANWSPATYTETTVPNKAAAGNDMGSRSWNLGQYVQGTPNFTTQCLESGNSQYDSVLAGHQLSRCYNFLDVTGWQPTFVVQAGTYKNGKYDLISIDEAQKIYDAHYLVGNYYPYLTATAGTSSGVVSVSPLNSVDKLRNASSSICPKGWRLPRSGRDIDKTSASFDKPFAGQKYSFFELLAAYGAGDLNYYGQLGGVTVGFNTGYPPFYYVWAGQINLMHGSLYFAGGYGSYISSTAYTSQNTTFNLQVNSSTFYPSMNSFYGESIRCVAH